MRKDRFDLLLQEPEDIIKEFLPNGDIGSPIPLEYQTFSHYSLSERGVFSFENDAVGNMDVVAVYSIPFVVLMNTTGLVFKFFVTDQVIEVTSNLDNFIESYFHSLNKQQKLDIKRYASCCIMKGFKS
jgi:hypothetical protein